jgi:hypothetical protein
MAAKRINYSPPEHNRQQQLILTLCAAVLSLVFLLPAVAQPNAQGRPPVLTQGDLENLLDTAGELAKAYTAAFKDLTAEDVKVVELYDKSGKRMKQRRIVSEFIVYQSLHDPAKTAEYRNVREVDGVPVSKREERVEEIFARAAKADSVQKELDRISREGTRYDFGYHLTGYTIYKGIALWKVVRRSFKFELEGREQIDGHETVLLTFDQIEPRSDLFKLDLPGELKPSDPRLRGRLWLDARTGQLMREHHEITFHSPYAPEPLVIIRTEYDFAPSRFNLWLPRRVVLNHFKPLTVDAKRKVAEMYRSARVVSEYSAFKRFNVDVREGTVGPLEP